MNTIGVEFSVGKYNDGKVDWLLHQHNTVTNWGLNALKEYYFADMTKYAIYGTSPTPITEDTISLTLGVECCTTYDRVNGELGHVRTQSGDQTTLRDTRSYLFSPCGIQTRIREIGWAPSTKSGANSPIFGGKNIDLTFEKDETPYVRVTLVRTFGPQKTDGITSQEVTQNGYYNLNFNYNINELSSAHYSTIGPDGETIAPTKPTFLEHKGYMSDETLVSNPTTLSATLFPTGYTEGVDYTRPEYASSYSLLNDEETDSDIYDIVAYYIMPNVPDITPENVTYFVTVERLATSSLAGHNEYVFRRYAMTKENGEVTGLTKDFTTASFHSANLPVPVVYRTGTSPNYVVEGVYMMGVINGVINEEDNSIEEDDSITLQAKCVVGSSTQMAASVLTQNILNRGKNKLCQTNEALSSTVGWYVVMYNTESTFNAGTFPTNRMFEYFKLSSVTTTPYFKNRSPANRDFPDDISNLHTIVHLGTSYYDSIGLYITANNNIRITRMSFSNGSNTGVTYKDTRNYTYARSDTVLNNGTNIDYDRIVSTPSHSITRGVVDGSYSNIVYLPDIGTICFVPIDPAAGECFVSKFADVVKNGVIRRVSPAGIIESDSTVVRTHYVFTNLGKNYLFDQSDLGESNSTILRIAGKTIHVHGNTWNVVSAFRYPNIDMELRNAPIRWTKLTTTRQDNGLISKYLPFNTGASTDQYAVALYKSASVVDIESTLASYEYSRIVLKRLDRTTRKVTEVTVYAPNVAHLTTWEHIPVWGLTTVPFWEKFTFYSSIMLTDDLFIAVNKDSIFCYTFASGIDIPIHWVLLRELTTEDIPYYGGLVKLTDSSFILYGQGNVAIIDIGVETVERQTRLTATYRKTIETIKDNAGTERNRLHLIQNRLVLCNGNSVEVMDLTGVNPVDSIELPGYERSSAVVNNSLYVLVTKEEGSDDPTTYSVYKVDTINDNNILQTVVDDKGKTIKTLTPSAIAVLDGNLVGVCDNKLLKYTLIGPNKFTTEALFSLQDMVIQGNTGESIFVHSTEGYSNYSTHFVEPNNTPGALTYIGHLPSTYKSFGSDILGYPKYNRLEVSNVKQCGVTMSIEFLTDIDFGKDTVREIVAQFKWSRA